MAISRTSRPSDIRALSINENPNGTTTIIIRDYNDSILASRTVDRFSVEIVVKQMGRMAIEIAKKNGVRYNQTNRFYALGLWRKK